MMYDDHLAMILKKQLLLHVNLVCAIYILP